MLTGRRREDLREGELPPDMQPGDYWKILDRNTGEPLLHDHPGKLTRECWHLVVPFEDTGFGPYAIANLTNHTVREEEDGSISVRAGDGSSNSILVTGAHGRQWHGYVECGVLQEC